MNRAEPEPAAKVPVGLWRILWIRFTLRHWVDAPGLHALLVLLLALGVGVFLAVRLANRSATVGFQNFTDLITTGADGLIRAPAGSLPQSILLELREQLQDPPCEIIPILETTATRPRTSAAEAIGSRETFQCVGVDLIGIQNLASQWPLNRSWWGQTNGTGTASASGKSSEALGAFRNPRAVFISERLARRDSIRLGEEIPLIVNDRAVSVVVAGLIPEDPGRPQPPEQCMIMDLPALQALTDREGRLDRVEFILPENPGRAAQWTHIKAVLQKLGQGRWEVATPADRRAAGEMMTRAFRLNLTILSLLALVVGLYLVFQALDGAVVRRREEIAILRSLGVRPIEIRRSWLVEAAALGVLGGILGILLGWAGAQAAVRIISPTVNALYHASAVHAARLHPGEASAALALAVLTSLVAGWLPARTAAGTPPAQILVRGGTTFPGPGWLRSLPLGGMALALGCALLPLGPWRFAGGSRITPAAYATALFWLLGAGILAGWVLQALARSLSPLGRYSHVLRLALSQVVEPSGRHRLALAGLVAAVAMTAGMAILVGSFDITMRGWIERTFQADLYLSSDGAQSASTQNRIRATVWKSIASHPAVRVANAVQVAELDLPGGSTLLGGGSLTWFRDHTRTAWVHPPEDDRVFHPDSNEGLCLVSEAFTSRFQMKPGDTVEIPTPSGKRVLRISGVFADYGNERGSIAVERGHFARWFSDEQASSLVLLLHPGRDPEALLATLQQEHPGVAIYTNGHLRREALRIFRQTFAITHALELIGLVVSVVGLGFTLMSLLLERRGELTTLRSLGVTRSEMAAATLAESALTAAAGVVSGLGLSLAMGWLLIHRVNKQTFGWTLETDHPWSQIAILSALVLGSAMLVGWWIGHQGARLPAECEPE